MPINIQSVCDVTDKLNTAPLVSGIDSSKGLPHTQKFREQRLDFLLANPLLKNSRSDDREEAVAVYGCTNEHSGLF